MRESPYNSESKLDRVTGGFCGILLNRLITAGSGGTAPLKSGFYSFLVKAANSAIISQVCVIES